MSEKIDAVMTRIQGELSPEDYASLSAQLAANVQRAAASQGAPQDINSLSASTINLMREAMSGNVNRAGINLATGYIGYDLQTPAATLVPYETPLLNMTPRVDGAAQHRGIDVHHWKAIVDLFGGNGPQSFQGGVADGGTPNFLSRSVVGLQNTFQTIAAMDSLTFQAEWRGQQLQGDLRSMMQAQLLFGLKLVEEYDLINWSDYLWTPPPMLITATNSGGTITSASGANMYFILTAKNANGETLGTSMQSVAVPGTTSSITLTIFTVPNATVYNVYAGQAASAPANGAMWLQGAAAQFGGANNLNQPTNFNVGSFTAVMTVPPATTGTAYSTVVAAGNTAKVQKDGSGNILSFQGVLSQIYANIGSGIINGTGGLKTNVIQPAATTGFLALNDVQTLFLNQYNNSRGNPTHVFVNPQDSISLSNLVASNGETRVVVDGSAPQVMNGQANLTAGFRVGRILNQVTQRLVDIVPLPFLPQGTIIAGSLSMPYPVMGYEMPYKVITNREYYGVEYPPTIQNPMQWGMGAFVDETLVIEFLGGWGILNGIVYH